MTFEEEMVVKKGRGLDMEIDDEEMEKRPSSPPIQDELAKKDEPIDPIDLVMTVDIPEDMTVSQKIPRWEQQTLQDAKGHEAPHGTFRERKIPQRFSSYVALMSHIIDSEPTTYEDASRHQVWKDAMVEEYQSIMKNDVWEIVPRPKGKSGVTSRWLYKIKHGTDGSI